MPNSLQFSREHADLRRRDRVLERTVEPGGRHVVVHRRDREVGPAHAAARHAQAVERLRRGDLVHEVEIDVEEVGLAVGRCGRRGGPRPSPTGSRCFGHVCTAPTPAHGVLRCSISAHRTISWSTSLPIGARTAPSHGAVSLDETLESVRGQCTGSVRRADSRPCRRASSTRSRAAGPCTLERPGPRDRPGPPDRAPARRGARRSRIGRARRRRPVPARGTPGGVGCRGRRRPRAGRAGPRDPPSGSAPRPARARSSTCAKAISGCAS